MIKKTTIIFFTLLSMHSFSTYAEENSESLNEQVECTAVTLPKEKGKNLNKGELPEETVKVPKGWKVVGGGASQGVPMMIICSNK